MSKSTRIDPGSLEDLIRFVTDMTTIAAVVFFSLGIWLSLSAGIFGLPLSVFLIPWFAKYLFVILRHAALGRPGVPVLSEEMVNPVHARPLIIFFLLLVFGTAYWSLSRFGDGYGTMVIAMAILLLPAMICIVAISDYPFRALNPLNIRRLVLSLRWNYAGVVIALGLLPVFLPRFIALGWPLVVISFVLLYWLLIVFRFLGYALYLARAEIGLQVEHAPEIVAAKQKQFEKVAHKACLDEIHLYASGGHKDRAYQTLCQHIHAQSEPDLAEAWFLDRLLGWEKPGTGLRLAVRVIKRLLDEQNIVEAWRWCARCLQVDTGFRVGDAAAALVLARYARQAGQKKMAFAVLRPFISDGGADLLSRDGLCLALEIASDDPALISEAGRLADMIERYFNDQLEPATRTLIQTIRTVISAR